MAKTSTEVPFKRKLRHTSSCLMITIPIDLIKSANLKAGQEIDFTMRLDFSRLQKQSILVTPLKA